MLAYLSGINITGVSFDAAVPPPAEECTLILGGYSYGSFMAKSLPPLQVVKSIFTIPASGPAQVEIMKRAQDLSKDYSDKLQSSEQPIRGRNSLRASAGLVVGGADSDATRKRMSRESLRRSLDMEGVRGSLDRMRKRSSRIISGRHDSSNSGQLEIAQTHPLSPKICYLLVSPLLAPVTSFLSMSSKLKLPAALTKGMDDASTKEQLLLHPSCCIFGHQDVFSSYKRLQKWAAKLQQESETKFSSYSVEQAGHFWQEEGAEQGLRDAIEQWLREM